MSWNEFLFGKKKEKSNPILTDYPLKNAEHSGKTFNDWRTMNGFSHEKGSVPEADLFDYCRHCGWPDKHTWQKIFNLSGSRLDNYHYTLWLKFIGVIDPDRKPEDSVQVATYINKLFSK